MKKSILAITFLVAGGMSLLAQGLLGTAVATFTNDPDVYNDGIDRRIFDAQGNPVADGSGFGNSWYVTLLENRQGTWTPLGARVEIVGSFGGAYPQYAGVFFDDGVNRPLSVAPRVETELAVRVEDGAGRIYNSYETGQDLLGNKPAVFKYTMAISDPPAPTDTLLWNFRGYQVPEPSTIALGVLGLGALLLFRRRK